ncbi:MAG: transposase [Bryobacteraceae bacterium]|nr:transposase [Bryobacteraceae bacterium]
MEQNRYISFMPKGYRPYLPHQDFLMPPSLREWLPEDHLVYFVSDVVEQLDLSAIHAHYGDEKRGQPPYDPLLMTKLLVYGYCTGVFSSRRIQKRIQEDIRVQDLGGGQRAGFPDDIGFPQDARGGAPGAVRAGAGDGVGERGGETGAGFAGWDEGEGQRQQAQGDELRADEGKATATARGSEGVAGAGRGRRRRRRPAARRQAWRRVAGRVAAPGDAVGQDQAG